MRIYEYDSFTCEKGKGNPAGVVWPEGKNLDSKGMQEIAKALGFNETVFILTEEDGYRFRFFSPGHEVNLCGHATIAGVGFLNDMGLLSNNELSVQTNIGKIQVALIYDDNSKPRVAMQQDESKFIEFKGSIPLLCEAIGITCDDMDTTLPVIYGSTGIWTLLVPLKTKSIFARLRPKNEMFPAVLTEMPRASIHPYSIEDFFLDNTVHARHFSSPFSQTVEDPVTGTASGVIGEFLLRQFPKTEGICFTVNQGIEIGRPGKVYVTAKRGRRVTISGNYVRNVNNNILYENLYESNKH